MNDQMTVVLYELSNRHKKKCKRKGKHIQHILLRQWFHASRTANV